MSIFAISVTANSTALTVSSNSHRGGDFCGEKPGGGYVPSRMKYLLMLAIVTAVICGFSGCATTNTTAKGDPVPGEKTGEESRLQPGNAAGPNASVKW